MHPAATDGIDPVLINPVMPPPAVRRARTKAEFELEDWSRVSFIRSCGMHRIPCQFLERNAVVLIREKSGEDSFKRSNIKSLEFFASIRKVKCGRLSLRVTQ